MVPVSVDSLVGRPYNGKVLGFPVARRIRVLWAGISRHAGEVPERPNGHAWKACRGASFSRVRIPPSPPAIFFGLSLSILVLLHFQRHHWSAWRTLPMRRVWLFSAFCLSAVAFVGCGDSAIATIPQPSSTVQQEPTKLPGQTLRETAVTQTPNSTTAPTLRPTAIPPTEAAPVEQVMNGQVLDALARNPSEIELLLVQDAEGNVWQFATDGPIGIDAAHLLVHRDTGEEVEVIFVERDGSLIALQVNDYVTQ